MSESSECIESSVLLWESLSLRQVDRLVCRWVQNWQVFESEGALQRVLWPHPGTFDRGEVPFPHAFWSPASDCYYVFYEDEMDAEPYLPSRDSSDALRLYDLPLFTNAAFFLNKKNGQCHAKLCTVEKRSFHGNAKTLSLAICQAVLTAYGIVTEMGEVYIP